MHANFWIISGLIATIWAAFALPYGFHLKSEKTPKEEAVHHGGDFVNGDRIAGNKFVVEGDIRLDDRQPDSSLANLKVTKLKIKREFEDFEHFLTVSIVAFNKQTKTLDGNFSSRGMSESGMRIKAQMNLAQESKDKLERSWIETKRKIEDILISYSGGATFDLMPDEFLTENNEKEELVDKKKEAYLFFEHSAKSLEQRIFQSDKITGNFKLR